MAAGTANPASRLLVHIPFFRRIETTVSGWARSFRCSLALKNVPPAADYVASVVPERCGFDFKGWWSRVRRLTLLCVICTAALFLGAVSASADNGPHVAGAGIVTGKCASCHRIQLAETSRFLTRSQPALCYSCHGGGWAGANTDVVNGVGFPGAGRSGTAVALRGGGFSYSLIDSAHPSGQSSNSPNADGTVPVLSAGAAVTSSHSVDSSSQMVWGNGPTSATAKYGKSIQLRCSSCHNPHGNGNYRILRPIPRDSGAKHGVAIPDATTKVYTTANYWRVADTNAPGFIANIAAWCSTCHTRYLSSAATDTGDAVYTYRHRSDQAAQGSANCIQCHVAHGSNASMGTSSGGVHNPDGVPAPSGSRLLRIDNRGVCQMCHTR